MCGTPPRQSFVTGLSVLIALSMCIGAAAVGVNAGAQEVRIEAFRMGGDGLRIGGDRAFEPAMNRRQLSRYADVLDLDESQRIVAEGILDMYQRDFDGKRRVVDAALRDLREEATATGDFGVIARRSGPVLEEWRRQRLTLEIELIDSLRSLLRDDQLDLWPRFERERRRAQLLPDARLGGEDVDVVTLVGGLNLNVDEETAASLHEVYEQYAIELDNALQARQRALTPLIEQWRQNMSDPERGTAIWRQGTALRAMVRDVNRRYVDIAAGLLDESEARRLSDAWERAAYPLAFEPTRAERLMENIRNSLSLSDSQRGGIEAAEADFLARLHAMRRRIIRQIIADEANPPQFLQATSLGDGRQAMVIRSFTGEEGDDPMSGLLREKFQLSRTFAERVESLLTEAQQATLPESPAPSNSVLPRRGLRFNL